MEFNRNQFFLVGLVIMLLGAQLRIVETFVLNEKASRFLAERLPGAMANADGEQPFMASAGATPRRTVRVPNWLGYALISIGAVLVLHSLAMKRPGG